MEVVNTIYRIARNGPSWLTAISQGLASALGPNVYPLRLSIVEVGSQDLTVEPTNLCANRTNRRYLTLRGRASNRAL